ncbi:MAG: alanine racemase [Candidatus Liptonbacteria bacterium]|nr:alanine racemase [Candidatus Liptonbacteria bacterium]
MSGKKLSDKPDFECPPGVRTWIELDANACRRNVRTFRRLVGPKVKLWAVVKSNAYGHGLSTFSKVIDSTDIDGFCVDSILEGLRLRKDGIRKPILVLGFTLPAFFEKAASNDIAVTISSFDSLRAFDRTKRKPFFHLKIDTGMHRQGFQEEEMRRAIDFLKKRKLRPEGAYSHLAFPESKKSSLNQQKVFERCLEFFKSGGIRLKWIHLSGTGGVCERRPFYNMVRVGFGLYGYFRRPFRNKFLHPVMKWKTVVTEVKRTKKGGRIGYDFTERFKRDSTIAILPVGYWHGVDRGLSGVGEVLVRGCRARIMGRVSMDMIAIDITDIRGVRIRDEVVLIGGHGKEFIGADEVAEKIDTTAYEVLTRINPLIQKIVV